MKSNRFKLVLSIVCFLFVFVLNTIPVDAATWKKPEFYEKTGKVIKLNIDVNDDGNSELIEFRGKKPW